MDISNIKISGFSVDELNAKLAEFNAAQGADGVSATAMQGEGTNVIITLAYGGQTQSITIDLLPELDPPDVQAQEEIAAAFEDLANKMKAMAESLKANESNPEGKVDTPPTTRDVQSYQAFASAIFDIYEMVRLLIETAQKQKENAAIVRQATSEAIQAEHLGKASQIESEAAVAYGLGLAAAIFSTVTTSISTVMSFVGMSKEADAMDNSGVTDGTKNVNNINETINDIKNTGPGANPADAFTDSMMESMGFDGKDIKPTTSTPDNPLTPEQIADNKQANFDKFMESKMPETSKAIKNADAKYAEVEANQKTVNELSDGVKAQQDSCAETEAKINADKAEIDKINGKYDKQKTDADSSLSKAEGEYNKAVQEQKDAQAAVDSNPNDQEAKTRLEAANKTLEEKTKNFDAAKDAHKNTCEKIEQDRTTDLKKANDTLKTDQKTLADQQKTLGEMSENLGKAKGDLQKSQIEYADALDGVSSAKEQDIGNFNKEIDDKIGSIDNKIKELRKDPNADPNEIDNLRSQREELVNARNTMEKIDTMVARSEDQRSAAIMGYKGKLSKAEADFNMTFERFKSDPQYMKGQKWAQLGQTINGIGQSMNQLFGAIKEKDKAKLEAALQEIDANIEALDNTKQEVIDLQHDAQDTIRNMNHLIVELAETLKQFVEGLRMA